MAIVQQILCDGCGEVLHGTVKGMKVRKDYLWLQGKLAYEAVDEELSAKLGNRFRDGYVFTFVTRNDAEQVAACDFDCLKSWAENVRSIRDKRRSELIAQGKTPIESEEGNGDDVSSLEGTEDAAA